MCSGRASVLLLVVTIVILFCLSCFLMSIVNPDKISSKDDNVRLHKNTWTKFFYPRVALAASKDGESLIPFYRYAMINKTDDREEYDTNEEEVPSTTIVEVTAVNVTKDNKTVSNANASEIIRALIKRRSIRNHFDVDTFYRFDKEFAGNTGIINVKLLNEDGFPRVEIKLDTNRYHRREKLSLDVSGDKAHKTIDLDYNTDIRIMPNNTIIVQSGLENFYNASKLINNDNATENISRVKENINYIKYINKADIGKETINDTKHSEVTNTHTKQVLKVKNTTQTVISKVENTKQILEVKNSYLNGTGITKITTKLPPIIKDNKRAVPSENKNKNASIRQNITVTTFTIGSTKSKLSSIDITNTRSTSQKPKRIISEKSKYKFKSQITTTKSKLKIVDDTTAYTRKVHADLKESPNFHVTSNYHG